MRRGSFFSWIEPPTLGRQAVLLTFCIATTAPSWAVTRNVPADYPTIQSAIDASVDGDTVLLRVGSYSGPGNRDIEFRGRDIVLTSSAGAGQTVIDCQHEGRGFYLHEFESRAARIEKVTIREGWARWEPGTVGGGGGISCEVSSPTIADCILTNNIADTDGGGIYILGNALVERCVIRGNYAGSEGGGIALEYGNLEVRDCMIAGNSASDGGGVACTGTASNTLTGCTISRNFAGHGGGVVSYNRVFLERCIVWGNSGSSGPELESGGSGGADIRCSDIDLTGVEGANVDYDEFCVYTDPLFCDPLAYEFSLDVNSPCLPEHSPCGELIGALGMACGGGPLAGACCFADGSCIVESAVDCAGHNGSYQGDSVPCDPNPCIPTAIETTTWGRIKVRFHEEGKVGR